MSKFATKPPYPRIAQLGLTVYRNEYPHLDPIELDIALLRAKLDVDKFWELFGVQTMILIDGRGCPYPCDVEAVLERMMSGRITGTQRYWD